MKRCKVCETDSTDKAVQKTELIVDGVDNSYLPIHKNPNKNSTEIAQAYEGDKVYQIGNEEKTDPNSSITFWYVEFKGKKGWASKNFLTSKKNKTAPTTHETTAKPTTKPTQATTKSKSAIKNIKKDCKVTRTKNKIILDIKKNPKCKYYVKIYNGNKNLAKLKNQKIVNMI